MTTTTGPATVALDGQFSLSLGAARFLDPDTSSPRLLVFLRPLDLFSLWVSALIAIGLSVTGGITLGRAAIGAAAVSVVNVLPRLPGALSRCKALPEPGPDSRRR